MSISSWKKEYYYGSRRKKCVGLLPQNLIKHNVALEDGLLVCYEGNSVLHKVSFEPFEPKEIGSLNVFEREAYEHYVKFNDPKPMLKLKCAGSDWSKKLKSLLHKFTQ